MRHSAITDHAQIRAYRAKRGHKQPNHKNSNERSAWRRRNDLIVFIATALVAAGLLAVIIKANQIDIAHILSPQYGTVSEARATNSPHDDICVEVFDDVGGMNNIKGLFEHGEWQSDCLARQISNDFQISN